MKQKYINISIVLILETIVLLYCSYSILKFIQNHQKQTNIIQLDKQNLLFPQIEGLKYFYEPKPNSIREDNIEWLSEIKKQFINSDSINSDRDFSVEKKNGTFRIITMGDSFTYGLYVNTNENWPYRLEQLLNKSITCPMYKDFEIINLGFPGYDIQHAVYRYKTRGKKYNPDLIIWFLKEDDFTQFTEISKKLADEKTAGISYKSNTERLNDYIKYLDESVQEIAVKYSQKEIEEIQNSLISEFSSFFSGKLLFTTMPYTSEVYKYRMQEWTSRRKSTFFLDKFTDTDAYKYPDGHPNALGHKKIADITYEALVQTVFTDCRTRIN